MVLIGYGSDKANSPGLTGMRLFFRISILYMVVSLTIMFFRYPNLDELVAAAVSVAVANAAGMKKILYWSLPVLIIAPFLIRWSALRTHASDAVFAAVGVIAIQIGFTFLKSAIPSFVPFYADPFFAELDKAMHGIDPWRLAHASFAPETVRQALPFYLHIWAIAAIALPILIAVTDRDPLRITRFSLIYLFVWIGLGNVAALAGSSVGPVFYDGLLGGTRFAELTIALDTSGVADSAIGMIQNYLWTAYESKALLFGSGISAFPSVHLGIATVAALYMYERSRYLAPIGIAFVAVVLFLSVYTGYHYALDGYFAILAVIAVWVLLRHRQGATRQQGAVPS